MLRLSSADLLFRHPARLIVSGPSASGKSVLVSQIVKFRNTLFTTAVKNVVCVYRHWQPLYAGMQDDGVHFTTEIPEDLPLDSILILDDLMSESSDRFVSIFTRESHHQNTTVIYLSQALFGNKIQRLLSINSTYIVLTKSVRDKLSISTFGRQAFPGQGPYFLDAYKKATSKPFGYLLVDLHPETRDQLRLRSSILPSEAPVRIYTPNKP